MCTALERRARPLNPHHCLHQTPLMKARCVSVSPAMMTYPALVSPCRLIRQVIKTGAGHVIKTGALTPWVGTAVRLRLHSVWRSDRRECARHQACRNTWSHFKCFGRSNCLLGIIGNATGQSHCHRPKREAPCGTCCHVRTCTPRAARTRAQHPYTRVSKIDIVQTHSVRLDSTGAAWCKRGCGTGLRRPRRPRPPKAPPEAVAASAAGAQGRRRVSRISTWRPWP